VSLLLINLIIFLLGILFARAVFSPAPALRAARSPPRRRRRRRRRRPRDGFYSNYFNPNPGNPATRAQPGRTRLGVWRPPREKKIFFFGQAVFNTDSAAIRAVAVLGAAAIIAAAQFAAENINGKLYGLYFINASGVFIFFVAAFAL